MIYIIDDFINKELFKETSKQLNNNTFIKYIAGNKPFYIQKPNGFFNEYVINKLKSIENCDIENILSFFRVSTNELDTTWRIHSDLNISGQKPDRAVVIYMSPKEKKELHGTALWEHKVYGKKLPEDTTDKEYNRMITKESENLNMWRLNSVIGYEQNRLISYPANYFHSKYPNKSWEKGRQVFVMFYKLKNRKK